MKAIIAYKEAPTIFFTFSSADMQWPELHSLFDENSGDLNHEQRRKNVTDNPHLVGCFFTKRIENLIRYWLYETLNAEWHWHRYEYQARGSIHCHGMAKLKDDPGMCKLGEIALKVFLAEKAVESSKNYDVLYEIEQGKEASQRIATYTDSLVSIFSPLSPETDTWMKPQTHPCRRKHEHIGDRESDYVDLLNTVQVVLDPLYTAISTRQISPRDAAWTPRGFDGINFSPGRFKAFFPPRAGSTRDDVITFKNDVITK